MTTVQHSKITDEMLAKARSVIGEERPYQNQWHEAATKDNIKHWAWGIGDPNPLWWVEEYAAKTKYGCIIAPPTFLYSCNCGPMWHPEEKESRGTGLPGLHRLWTGDSWEFYKTVKVNDRIVSTHSLYDIIEKTRSAYVDRMFQEINRITFKDQQGEIVAKCWTHTMAFERGAPKEKGKYMDLEKYRYTDEELEAIERDIDKEELRGAVPRYWEDVKEGDEIPHVVKGPLTMVSMVTFFQGWGGHFCMTDRILHLYFRAHPKAAIRDPQTNIPDVPTRVHWDPWFAKEIGMSSGGYDIGGQRISWYGHCLTNWMGDDGFLKKLRVEMRRPNFLGDTTWIRGKVTRKYVEAGEHLVECELWGDNQRGERHSTAWSTVALPTRSG